MRHRWDNREQALEAIKIHYTGTPGQKQVFANKEGQPWVELMKGFSALIKRFKIKPSEIGVSRFGRDVALRNNTSTKSTKPTTNKNEKLNEMHKLLKQGISQAQIARILGVSEMTIHHWKRGVHVSRVTKANIVRPDNSEMAEQIYKMRQSGMDFSEIKKKFNITNNQSRRLYQKHYNKMYHQKIPMEDMPQTLPQTSPQSQPQQANSNSNIQIAEQQLIQFFSEIDRHTPEQVKQTVNILSNFLRGVKGLKGDKDDILNFLSQNFPNQLTPIVSPDDLDNWLVQ
jgi:DNA-binding transcriptional regulator YiaG